MGHRTHAAQLLFVFVLAIPALTAQAAVYRCGTTYQDMPCAGGSTIQAEDPRSPQQKAEAARAVQKDAATADALRKQRVQQEAQWANQQQAAHKAQLAQEADLAKEAKAQAEMAAKAEAQRQREHKPRKVTTHKTALPKASAARAR